jgi:hypothetical protein
MQGARCTLGRFQAGLVEARLPAGPASQTRRIAHEVARHADRRALWCSASGGSPPGASAELPPTAAAPSHKVALITGEAVW